MSSPQLSGYADSNYANNVATGGSTTGYTISIGGFTVCWRPRRQHSLALFTAEADHMAMGDCAKHVIWFCQPLFFLTMEKVSSTSISMMTTIVSKNNNGALFISEGASDNSRSKHIDICDLVKQGATFPEPIDTNAMPVDYLTKAATQPALTAVESLWVILHGMRQMILHPVFFPSLSLLEICYVHRR